MKLSPGKYRMVCTVADHEQLGMVGDLEVTARGAGTAGAPRRKISAPASGPGDA